MKRFEYVLENNLYGQAVKAIRKKYDLIKLLMYTIQDMLLKPVHKTEENLENCRYILYIDRMSRIFYCFEDKIFTFNFPFVAHVEENRIHFYSASGCQLDSVTISMIINLLNESESFENRIVFDEIVELIDENGVEDAIEIDCFYEIVKELMLFEPGYLRYDHDIFRANKRLHPEHHIDLYFSQSNSAKIGYDSKIDIEWLINMLDTQTDSVYIES